MPLVLQRLDTRAASSATSKKTLREPDKPSNAFSKRKSRSGSPERLEMLRHCALRVKLSTLDTLREGIPLGMREE